MTNKHTETKQDPLDMSEADMLRMEMALQRMQQPLPDVDQAWQALSQRIGVQEDAHGVEQADEPADEPAAGAPVWLLAAACVAALLVFIPWTSNTAPTPQGNTEVLTQKPSTAARTAPSTAAAKQEAAPAATPHTLTLTTKQRELHSATLPDGSRIWLNAGTTVHYTDDATARTARINGEAYLEVKHDAARPFHVHTQWYDATDIGTAFNVKAYSAREAQLTVVEGSVAMMLGSQADTLTAGMQGTARSGSIKVEQVDTYPLTQWRDGWFYFKDEPLVGIMQELARWYDVNVVFETASATSSHVHFVASRTDSLSVIAQRLAHTAGVELSIHDGTVTVK